MAVTAYVGRVGALAVVLGIGTATGGVAWADDSSTDSSTPAASVDSAHPTGTSRTSHIPRATKSASGSDQNSTESTPDRTAHRPAPTLPNRGVPGLPKNVTPPAAAAESAPAPRASVPQRERVAIRHLPTIDVPAAPTVSVTAAAVATPSVDMVGTDMPAAVITAAPAESVPVMTPPAPTEAAPAPAAVMASVLNPLFGGNSTGPTESPATWVVLAAVRRQIGVIRAATVPAATSVSTGQLRTGPSAAATAAAVTNSPPVISGVALSSPNATTGAVTGTVTASDPNRDAITYKATTSTKGTVTITSGGVFTYTPTATARHAAARIGATTSTTSDIVTVTVTDSKGAATTSNVTVPISPKNSVPTATKTVGTPNTTTGVVTGTVTGTDADKDTLTYTGSATTAKGTVIVTSTSGAFTYTPTATARHAAAKIGATTADTQDTFTVTVSDGYGGSLAVPVTVTVSPKNSAPVSGTSTIGTPDATTGVVLGTAKATDGDADVLTFSAPATTSKGSVTVNPTTGAFTYTPTDSARNTAAGSTATAVDKVDSFTVTVADGYNGTTSIPISVTVSPKVAIPVPGNVKFTFNYGSGSQYWTPESKAALEKAASAVAASIVAPVPVTIVYNVTATKTTSRTLATATSDLTSGNSGFNGTVVQNKIITGIDPNGTAADGVIDVNFGMPWSFTDSVSGSQYDFTSTAMHEIVHSMGFISFVDKAGYNTRTAWTKYDSFLVNSGNVKLITPSTFKFNTTYNSALTGSNGGVYFGGPNAVAAYGGLVPLYTPSTWAAGSSINHLRDTVFTGTNAKLMNALVNTGLGTRKLSAVELGILKDLGYSVVPVQAGGALLFVLVVFMRRRRND